MEAAVVDTAVEVGVEEVEEVAEVVDVEEVEEVTGLSEILKSTDGKLSGSP